MEWRAERLTASICHLYETLKVVADKMEDEEIVVTPHVLTYYNKNYEINELHLAFNSVVKTMVLAHHQGEDTQIALLNYSDAYYIEQYDNDDVHKGICLANIGMLMMQ